MAFSITSVGMAPGATALTRIFGANSADNVQVRLRAMVRSHSSRGRSLSGMRMAEPPAFLTQSVKGPKVSTAAWARASTASSSVASVVTASAAPPAARMRSATASISSVRRAATTTDAPASVKATAMPSPMPRPAPVTTATWPVISNSWGAVREEGSLMEVGVADVRA